MLPNPFLSPQKLVTSPSKMYSHQANPFPHHLVSPKRVSPLVAFDQFTECRVARLISPKKLEHINCIQDKKQVIGAIFIGDTISTLKYDILMKYEIGAVLCCNIQASKNLQKWGKTNNNCPQFKFCNIQDNKLFKIDKYFTETFDFIEKMRNNGKNVLIQCHAGVSRSGSILCAYLIKKNKWSFQKTFEFVTSKRPRIKPNEGFWRILEKYSDQLLSNKKQQKQTQKDHATFRKLGDYVEIQKDFSFFTPKKRIQKQNIKQMQAPHTQLVQKQNPESQMKFKQINSPIKSDELFSQTFSNQKIQSGYALQNMINNSEIKFSFSQENNKTLFLNSPNNKKVKQSVKFTFK